jgi:hypothetical protein
MTYVILCHVLSQFIDKSKTSNDLQVHKGCLALWDSVAILQSHFAPSLSSLSSVIDNFCVFSAVQLLRTLDKASSQLRIHRVSDYAR